MCGRVIQARSPDQLELKIVAARDERLGRHGEPRLRRLHKEGWDAADNVLVALANLGYWPERGTRFLILGCGDGAPVYALRDRGFEAYGFDKLDNVVYREPADRRFFRFHAYSKICKSGFGFPAVALRFPDDTFDVVVSSNLIGHSEDLAFSFAEVARVLRPGGCSLHLYSSRSVLIEPQTRVPLATRIQKRWWFRLWAALGVRSDLQHGLGSRDVATAKMQSTRLFRYHSARSIYRACARSFGDVSFADWAYYPASTKAKPLSRLRALVNRAPLDNLVAMQRMAVLFAARKLERRQALAVERGNSERTFVEREPVAVPVERETLVLGPDLLRAGFSEIGEWELTPSGGLRGPATAREKPCIYAFLIEDAIVYVGLATFGVSRRLRSYEIADAEAKNRTALTFLLYEALADGQQVKVLAADAELMDYNGIPVDVAAGLESALIVRARPLWNIMLQAPDLGA